jgi:elongation factor 1-gamma
MSLKIYSFPNNPRVNKALVAAKYVGVEIETPAFNFGEDNKTSEFLKKNPLGKVPVLDAPEGPVWESNAIARYVARKGDGKLLGANAYEQALVDQWIDFASGELDLPARAWLYPIWGLAPNNPEITKRAQGDVRKALETLNKHFSTRTWAVGERVTLADIVLSAHLYTLYTTVLDPGFRKAFTHLNRWFLTALNQPEFKAVYGEVKLAEKMAQAPKAAAPAEQPKKEQPKKEQPKKEQPKKEPEAASIEDEIEAAEKAEKKQPNPLDLLPPTKLDLDSWKRMYSNNDTRTVALPWFWENFDKEGWSLWFADYKYNDELEKLFKTNNFVGGWLQRLDKLRKYGFGSVLIFGEEPNLSISSAWLFRGHEVPKEMTDCDDYELYNWRKVDTENPTDKALFEDLLAWNGKFDGRSFFDQGKVFK